jgi:F-type H+-transporting ATPase subunit alpha
MNPGISVSRVGGAAQIPAMKHKLVAGGLRLALAAFRELEAFAAFGSDLDAASKAQLDRGARLVELLKQPQYTPFSVEDEVISVWAGTTGQLDDVPVEDIRRFEAEFLAYVRREAADAVNDLKSTLVLSDESVAAFEKAVTEFKKGFTTAAGHLLINDAPVEAIAEEDIDPTKITKVVR